MSQVETVVRESQIEDILVGAPAILKDLLSLPDEPRIIIRQMVLPSGRLDMLLTCRARLQLVELKIAPYQPAFVDQVLTYKNDLRAMQSNGRLVHGEIQPFLLCTRATDRQKQESTKNGVESIIYNPYDILEYYFTHLKPIASFTEGKPIDIGIWNIHLIHELLYLLSSVSSVRLLHDRLGRARRTLYNKIKFAHELRLVIWQANQDAITLSDLGMEYVRHKDEICADRLSESQAGVLRDFIMRNPFESSVILGIASLVESVLTLAKNTHPVSMTQLMAYFTYHAGKHFDWQTRKARYNGTHMYCNYATDLGLTAKSGNDIYLTPAGFRFSVQMQLHKALKMLENATFV